MIQIICVDISSADEDICGSLYGRASLSRRNRADRYRRQEDWLRCVAAEALLRYALGVTEDQIERSSFGKPYIKTDKNLFCNLSHSGRYVVLAWGNTEMGVDVQQHNPKTDIDAIGQRFFAPDEREYAQGSESRFYEIWTKKESYLKYTGNGLHTDLCSFSVLSPAPKIHYFYRMLGEDHSLSLCTEEAEYGIEMLDIQQL